MTNIVSVPVLLHLFQGCFYWEIKTLNKIIKKYRRRSSYSRCIEEEDIDSSIDLATPDINLEEDI